MFLEQVDQDEDFGRDAGLSERDAFLDRCHGQSGNVLLDQRAGDFDCPVTVGIGLDDGHDLTVLMEALSDVGIV